MRWRFRRRRWGNWRRRHWRRRYRKRRPRYNRRTTVRRRRRGWAKVPRRKKARTTFWHPATRVKCNITGWTIGLTSKPENMERRCWHTVLFGDNKGTIRLVGGGVAVRVFSLRMLWWEHQLFRNWWSRSNDGFDLARYLGTTFYLPPHRDNSYIFWWDTDYNQLRRSDFWRAHPSILLGYKNKVIVRSQQYGRNQRVKKVFIKPPATTDNEWRFQNQWMEMGLTVYGITVIDWHVPFARNTNTTLDILSFPANIGEKGQSTRDTTNVQYAFYADFPHGNRVLWKTTTQKEWPTFNDTGFKYLQDADDLPYWLTFYGQNDDYYFDDPEISQAGLIVWIKIYYPVYKVGGTELSSGNYGPKDAKAWMIISSATAKLIAKMGPFINTSNTTGIEIPIMYRSKWEWGGATYAPQYVTDPLHFAPKQVSIKNPATVQRSIITPWDTQDGILTKEALHRFLKSPSTQEERRPLPGQPDGWPAWSHDTPHSTSSSEDEETPESDEEGGPSAQERALETLRKRVHKEREHRHKFHKFLKLLIKNKD
uniref:Capsid protein n=1 Tax=Paguma larvata torque teno virus TaxID=2219036 RepID=A0A348BSP8_9VIRU|nr:hypothetical protein [Paguma larvata torque teno virus]